MPLTPSYPGVYIREIPSLASSALPVISGAMRATIEEESSLPPLTRPIPGLDMLHSTPDRSSYRQQTEQSLREAVAEIMALSEEELVRQAREDAVQRKGPTDRCQFERLSQNLGQLYHKTGDQTAARRAAIILYVLADDGTRFNAPNTLGFHDLANFVPLFALLGYNFIYKVPVWDELSSEYDHDVREMVEGWISQMAWLQAKLGQNHELNNLAPFGIARGVGSAIVLNDAELIRANIRLIDRMLSGNHFHIDGTWREGTLSYHAQVHGRLNQAISLIEKQWSDPVGYEDQLLGLSLDRTEISVRWPIWSKSKQALETARYPDGRLVPFGDTHWSSPGQIKAELLHNIELWHYGLFGLTGGDTDEATQVILQFPAINSGMFGGHRHADSLAMILFATGDDILPDAGYAFKPANYRYYHMNLKAHNIPWVWSDKHNYRETNGHWARSALLAYDPGNHCDKQVQIIEATAPGPVEWEVDTRRRLLMLIAVANNRAYTFDLSRLKGGQTHEWYLRQSENEDCDLVTELNLEQQADAHLGDYLTRISQTEGVPVYRDLQREPRVGNGSQPFKFTWTGKKSGSSLHAWLNNVSDSEVFFTRVPRVRPTQQDANQKDNYPGWHLSRRFITNTFEALHLTFSEEELEENDVASLKNAGWKLNPAADHNDAFFLKRGELGNLNNYLTLKDIVNDGTPNATFEFGSVVVGMLDLRVGTNDLQNQYGRIALMSGESVLAQATLNNNTSGQFISGKGTYNFQGSWFRSGINLRFSWRVNPDGTNGKMSFLSHDTDNEWTEHPFQNNGVPDRIRFQVGYGGATNRALLIDQIKLTPKRPMTRYAAIYDATRVNQSAIVQDVTWSDPAPTDEAAIVAQVSLSNGHQDIIYVSNDTTQRQVELGDQNIELAGRVAIIRREASGQMVWAYLLGPGSIQFGDFILSGEPEIKQNLIGVTRQLEGHPSNALLVEGSWPSAQTLKDKWLSVVNGDDSSRGMQLKEITSLGDQGLNLITVHDDPAIEVSEEGTRQLYFPMRDSKNKRLVIPGPTRVNMLLSKFSRSQSE